MSKELFERIENYRRLSFDSDDLDAIDLLTDCQQRIAVDAAAIAAHEARIEELERRLRLEKQLLATVRHTVVAIIGGVDYDGYTTSEINYLQRLRILVEKEQENSRLQAQLEAAEGVLRELNETSTVLTEKLIEEYFRAKEGKENA